ncbi:MULTISPECIES: DHA2 family efflux MFS transporter permease subunit [unclassified Enterococcus]|uniref:DHA2 family efflux MFS transporter permease subunit n=1 Tax=unclassified Enterococcus TaxID=2608891 RepID=UPI0032DF58A2
MNREEITIKTKLMIIAAALMGFGGIMSETAMNVTFPELTKVFNISMGTISWVTTAYLLAVAIVMTLSSFLYKRFMNRSLFLISVIVFIIGTIVGGLAQNFEILLIGRILQGIGAGISLPLTFNLILEYVPMKKLGLWMGFASMILSLAPSIGPTYGGLLIDTLGWRMIFYTTLAIPVIALLIGFSSFEKVKKPDNNINFDFIAFILLSAALTSLLIMVTELESGHFNLLLLMLFIMTIGLFIWRSLTSQSEFLNIRVLGKLSFLMALIPFFFYQFANIGGNFIIPNYLQIGFGVSSLLAGFSLLPGTLLAGLLNPIFGKIYDKKGEKIPLYVGNSLFLIALILMSILTENMGFIGMTVLYTIFALGRVMSFGVLNTSALAHLKAENRADGSAIFQTAQQFAGALGTAIVALISAASPNIKVGMNHTLLLFCGLGVIIFILFIIMFKTATYQNKIN